MALIKTVRNFTPEISETTWLADNAVVVGDVKIGEKCSLWFHAVVRGDVNSVRIGHRVNIQDGAIIHCTYEKTETHIGDNVSIGHRAIVHGCTVEDNALIGMGAIVMDNAVIPSDCIVAAGALVPENKILESGWIYAGVPARKFKPLTDEQRNFFIERTAKNYVEYAGWMKV
ncbi:MAG: gamma carbonic anhydrase family protein [Saprospiraceae bacterium]|nr:gamma carbonic anhydrase family protein [Saprospiraceae bacterium]